MTTITILVVLFLVVLFVLGFRVVFSKKEGIKIGGGGGVTASDSKSEKHENHENN